MLKIYAGRRELKLREGKSTVETDVSPQTDWGSSCTVQVYSYKCIVVTLELWRFQLGSKITLLEMHSFYKLFIESKRNICKRSIFQTFWKLHCCPDFLFNELETSNFGYLLIF